MRIHSDILTPSDVFGALAAIPGGGVSIPEEHYGRHGSRSRATAFEVKLRGHGARHTRRPNAGVRAASYDDGYAATYDDWGFFLAGIFALDPTAICGPYKSSADFLRLTTARDSDAERNPAFVAGRPMYPIGSPDECSPRCVDTCFYTGRRECACR